MPTTTYKTSLPVAILTATALCASSAWAKDTSYTIVDTGQNGCYSNDRSINCPEDDNSFAGQDAQYRGNLPSYVNNGNGTITDMHTGLMWQKTPSKTKISFADANAQARELTLAGHTDWRLPSIKELYSLIDFRGQTGRTQSTSIPYINTDYFDFYYGNTAKGERLIDAQYWSSTEYTGKTMNNNPTAFGVNFADGRIKGYPSIVRGERGKHFVRYVRGNSEYGKNKFVDNSDGTITDQATGLIWMQVDSGRTLNWQQALAYAENKQFAGHSDWRLPDAKELQSIVDYSKSPQAGKASQRGLSIDPLFTMTDPDAWYWTSTTHLEHGRAGQAAYLCFGQGWGYMGFGGSAKQKLDVHGAGAQRSDPKSGNPTRYAGGRGPQGDEIRIYNYVRLVRGGDATQENRKQDNSGSYEQKAGKAAIITASSYNRDRRDNLHQRHPKQQGGSEHFGQNTGSGRRRTQPGGGFVERLDRNGDGRVSVSEFDGPPHHFATFDTDGDGYLNENEAPKGPPPRRK